MLLLSSINEVVALVAFLPLLAGLARLAYGGAQ